MAPMISAHRSAICGWAGTLSRAMIRNETNANASVPPASPSRPSVMLTPFEDAKIANAAKKMYTSGSMATSNDR